MNTLGDRGSYRRVFCALIWVAALVLVAGTAAAEWKYKDESGYRTYYWDTPDNYKFQYSLSTFQWSHWSSIGSTWYAISATGRPETFIGDGSYYDLGNGFSYSYLISSNSGWFVKGIAGRFSYLYTPGQWRNYSSFGGWQNLGNAGLSAGFMGDGGPHDLGNGYSYSYSSASDSGQWTFGSATRYAYDYIAGQWYLYGYTGERNPLGTGNLPSTFMGDNAYHDLGNYYYYRGTVIDGSWSTNGLEAGDRYHYTFSNGCWTLRGYGGAWHSLGSPGLSSSFMGDNAYHDLKDGYYYQGWLSLGFWSTTGYDADLRYYYEFPTGQWYLKGYGGTWNRLGTSGLSSNFMGNGGFFKNLNNGFYYREDPTYNGGTGFWSTSDSAADVRYLYEFETGQWYLRGYGGGAYYLGYDRNSSEFVGDGAYHKIATGWWYREDSGMGYWYEYADEVEYFRYRFSTGQWQHQGSPTGYPGFNDLGGDGMSSSFLGDGKPHDLGNTIAYQYLGGYAIWTDEDTGQYLFEYDYQTGRWSMFWDDEWVLLGYGSTGKFNPGVTPWVP